MMPVRQTLSSSPLRPSARLALVSLAWLLVMAPLTPVLAQGAQPEVEGGPGGEPPDPDREEKIRQADRLYQIGLLQFEGKEFAAAAESFLRAFELDPNPVLAYNVARAFENDGDRVRAREFYARALDLNPPREVRSKCEDALIRLKRFEDTIKDDLAARPGVLQVNVVGGGTVYIDGQERGPAPVSLELPAGTYALEVRRPGASSFEREVELVPGGQVVVDAALEERFSVAPWVGWTGGGILMLGLGLGVLGATFAFDAQDAFDEAQTLEAQRDPERFALLQRQGEDDRLVAITFYTAAGLTAAAGLSLVVLYFAAPDEITVESASTTPSLLLAPDAVQLQWRW